MALQDVDNSRNNLIAANFGYVLCPIKAETKWCSWKKPDPDSFKINTDALLDSEGGGIGGLIRDEYGMVIAMFSMNVEREEIFELELLAVHQGITLAREMGLKSIWIESDSKLAIDMIIGTSSRPWSKLNLIKDIKKSLACFDSWKLSHIWREDNAAADFL
ncbi:uncharacterized protein LOC143865528 [Tasmannia lanceolata]|uniref:uncharacterized protein LOC143865528 n=1 Tax=Tasmannia lanceolata TaxID=3420 RepID=UPI0040644092